MLEFWLIHYIPKTRIEIFHCYLLVLVFHNYNSMSGQAIFLTTHKYNTLIEALLTTWKCCAQFVIEQTENKSIDSGSQKLPQSYQTHASLFPVNKFYGTTYY